MCSDRYRRKIAELLDAKNIEFRFHWHYTPNGCSVSPHTDARREHGSHLFYFNSEDDWDPSWGGDTLVLDDGGRLDYNSAPPLEAFDREIACESLGNYSSIMLRNDHAWHAVREINCPEDKMRRIFIVVVNPDSLFWKVRDKVLGKTIQRFQRPCGTRRPPPERFRNDTGGVATALTTSSAGTGKTSPSRPIAPPGLSSIAPALSDR